MGSDKTSKSAQDLNGDVEEFDKELAKINNNNGRWEEEASDWDTKRQAEWTPAPAKTFQPPLSQELQLQLDAARAFKVLFFAGREDKSGHFSSDSEEEEEQEEGEQGGEQGGGGSAALADKENEVRSYFESALYENEELRRLYVENCKRGLFQCAVCAATNGKVWRIYPNCAGLIQHSMTVLHTKSKAAHRGYGRAICGLLGWDSDKFLGLLGIKKLKSLNLSSKGEESDKETDFSVMLSYPTTQVFMKGKVLILE
ncbi:hypothetical protein SUGI_0755950 [Cryptomeria japonica]|nr:hypothetical protein SUGI_0755950 [Cryptomeria japonica]